MLESYTYDVRPNAYQLFHIAGISPYGSGSPYQSGTPQSMSPRKVGIGQDGIWVRKGHLDNSGEESGVDVSSSTESMERKVGCISFLETDTVKPEIIIYFLCNIRFSQIYDFFFKTAPCSS